MNQTAIYLILALKLIDAGIDPTSLRVEVYRSPQDFSDICRGFIRRGEEMLQWEFRMPDVDRNNTREDVNRLVADRAFFTLRERLYPNRHNWVIAVHENYERLVRQQLNLNTPVPATRTAPVDNFVQDGIE